MCSTVFSERELTFTFAICCRSSVCLSSVTFVHPTQAVQIFGNISTALGTLAIHWKFHGDRPRGTPPLGELNTSIAISDLSMAISRKWCKIGGKLVLITNRKSYTSFWLVQKSVTLNDLEWRNGVIFRYFGEFRWLPGALHNSSRFQSHLLMSSCSKDWIPKQYIVRRALQVNYLVARHQYLNRIMHSGTFWWSITTTIMDFFLGQPG